MARCSGSGSVIDVDAGQTRVACPDCARDVIVLVTVSGGMSWPTVGVHVDVRPAEVPK